MKNITLSVDEHVLEAVRRYAVSRGSSVNRLVREYLADVAGREDRVRQARERIRAMSRKSRARIGAGTWTRDQLHER